MADKNSILTVVMDVYSGENGSLPTQKCCMPD